ncbi:thioredoxin family protein [Phreatobacter sp.]|uniref:thioredoxin family protein n=1 Tax=Phreatobacter sp. TaxID=1966341 RepID=UPI003F70156A
MFDRRHLLVASAALPLLAVRAHAAPRAFTPAAFQAAQAAGRPILVEVSAPWCPTCRAQKPILSDLTASERFRGFVVLTVDFDSQKDVLRQLRVQMQSTLIVFRGTEEKGRSTGDTNRASIETLLAKAI